MIAARTIACRIRKQSSKFCPFIMRGEGRERGEALSHFFLELSRDNSNVSPPLRNWIGVTGNRLDLRTNGNKVWKLVRRRRECEFEMMISWVSGTNSAFVVCRDKRKRNWKGILCEYGRLLILNNEAQYWLKVSNG